MTLARRLSRRQRSFARRRGAAATLRVVTGEVDDANLNRTTTYADHQVYVLFQRRLQTTREGALVQLQELRAVLSAAALPAGVVPSTTSLLVIGSRTYHLVSDEPTGPGSSPISYEFELRQ